MYVKNIQTSCFWQVGDIMNMMKNVALMAMGGAVTLAYQKYNKRIMNSVKNAFSNVTQEAEELTDKLDSMM